MSISQRDQGDGHHCPVDVELTWSGSGRLLAMASGTDPEKHQEFEA